MAGGNVSAVPAPKGLELGFVDKDGKPIEEARYGLFDHAFVGTTLENKKGEEGFISKDSRSFRLRVKTPLGGGKKQLKATWRTLWPMKPEELAEADAGGPLDGKMIHQSEMTLTLTKEKGVYLSEPVMLVAGKADLVAANVGWKDADSTEGAPDYRLLLAHVQGHVQLEHTWGKGKVVRRSIPVWKKVRTLWIQNLVCERVKGDTSSPNLKFDPREGTDKEFLIHGMRQLQQIYAVQGIYANTWQPGADVHVVQDGGTAYSFRFVAVPRAATPKVAGDPTTFQAYRDAQEPCDPVNMGEWSRCVRYAREYPAWSPNAIRIFYAWQSGGNEDSFHGTATGDNETYAKGKGTVANASLVPARRSVFIMHTKGLATDPAKSFVIGEALYGPGPYTIAHEVGHVLAPKGPDTHGADAHAAGSLVFLMVKGATDGTFPKSLEAKGTRRIFDEPVAPNYKWLERMQTFPGLEG